MSSYTTPSSAVQAGPLSITGDFSISAVAAWHRQIGDYLAATPAAVIELSGVTNADVFGVQLLCAVRQVSREAGQTLRVTGASEPLLAAAAAAGIAPTSFLLP